MSDKKVCILLSGYAGSGKDTVAEYITGKYKQFEQFSLAQPIKHIAMLTFGIEENKQHYFTDRDLKETIIPGHSLSAREMMQIIGNEFRNIFYPEVWCENLKNRAWRNSHIVISDQRYANESEYFDKIYDKVISVRIDRPDYDGNVGISNHPSEAGEFIVQYIIDNSKDKDHLFEGIETVMKCAQVID